MQQLLEALRKACSAAVWSRGVELSRRGAVFFEGETQGAVELRVAVAPGMPSPLVALYPGEADWSCECPSREPACVHVAAAAIALSRAKSEGQPLPRRSEQMAHVRYLLTRAPGGLALSLVLATGAQAQPLAGTLARLSEGPGGAPFAATQADLRLEVFLGARGPGPLPRETLGRLLPMLADCEDVRLDGKPIEIGEARPVLRAVLEDCAEGVRLRLEQDPAVDELFANGAVRTGLTLRPMGDVGFSARELEELRRGRVYRGTELLELQSRVVPQLKKRLPVVSTGRALPQATRQLPRIQITTERRGDLLSVLATLVYGDPPTARLDGDELHALGGPLPVRDVPAEQRLKSKLERDLGLRPGERCDLDAHAAIPFATRLASWQGEIRGDGHGQFFAAGRLRPRLSFSDGVLELEFEESGLASARDAAERHRGRAGAGLVLDALRRGESLVPLTGGGFAELPRDWLAQHGRLVADLLAARDEAGHLPASALGDLGRLCTVLGEPAPPELGRLAALASDFTSVTPAELPADLTAELRPYQRRGVDWLSFLCEAGLGGLLADDMGLGKTVQALCAVRGRTLVVAPTSVLPNWAAEAARFRPSLRVSVYHGAKRSLDPAADLTLTTYAILRLEAATLAEVPWDCVVIDESQNIKNPDSQVARAAYGLQGAFRLALTGTPVENRLDELWSQFNFINRGLLGSRSDFEERYARPIASGDDAALAHLQERLRPFVLRRLKREVAPDLPPRTEVTLWVELSAAERASYDAVRAATLDEVARRLGANVSVMEILEALLRLRQAACHSALLPGQEAASSSKIELLLETLDEALSEGHKALVFSQWTSLLDLLEPHLQRAAVGYCRLDGATRDRGAVVEAFQRPGGPPVMLISLKAGGSGLNLTAADHVFLMDPWWNPAVEDQAADRAHRLGQERPVLVHRLVAQDTVEERILALQERKRQIAASALAQAQHAVDITKDELLALLA
jgi:superfamily II DNA or RNA helicase